MTPLVLVHGFLGGSEQWKDIRRDLGQSFEIVTVDLPGFGKNADLDPRHTINGYATWVLDALAGQGIDRFHLLGHSMGGMIAQEIVALAPDKIQLLVLYGTGATGVLPGRFEPIETSRLRAQKDGPRRTARRIAATWFLEQEAAPAFEDCAAIAEVSTLKAIHAGLDAMQAWTGENNLQNIRSETLIIWGDQDRTYPWRQTEQLWTSIKNSKLAVLPNYAHAAHLENPNIFNFVLMDFLGRTLENRSRRHVNEA